MAKKTAGETFDNVGETGELVFKFANADAARHFKLWLCESGEQSYWDWMTEREQEEEGDITATSFDYHTDDNTIGTTTSRQDNPE